MSRDHRDFIANQLARSHLIVTLRYLYCSNRDLESSDNPTPAPAAEPDLLQERAVLFDFLAKTIDSDDSEDNEVDCVCSNWKHPPKERDELKGCSRCY